VFAVIIVPVVVVIFLMERVVNLSRQSPIHFFAKEEDLRENLHKIGSQTT